MPFASILSTVGDTKKALADVCREAEVHGSVDLALLFYSHHHAGEVEYLARQTRGQQRSEIETGPALALWLARFNQPVELTPFQLAVEETSDGYSLLGWPDNLHGADPKQSAILLLADPFTFPVDQFLQQVNKECPGLRVMGGMASGGRQPGENTLLL